MKKCLLFFLVILFSCSKDGVDTGSADRVVGTWKTAIITIGTYRTQTTWEIIKKDEKSVFVEIYRGYWPNPNSDEGYENDRATSLLASMSDRNTLVFEVNTAASGAAFCGLKGTGKLSGDKLTMVTSTVCSGYDPDPVTEEFTKQ